jgi:hypothetical protein
LGYHTFDDEIAFSCVGLSQIRRENSLQLRSVITHSSGK